MRAFAVLVLFFFLSHSYGQTLFWSDTFEDAGAPSSGTRTPSVNFSCGGPPATNYFFRTNTSGINLQSGTYSGMEGSKFWAAEDIDFGPTCTNLSISANQQVTWSNINISGKTNLSFKGLFAANSSFPTNWEGSSFGVNQDYMVVEYRIDGGAWTKAVAFYAGSTAQTPTLKLETTGDLVGDGGDLTYAFTEFSANLTGTGTVLDLRLNVFANGGATEEIAADNFRLYYGLGTLPVKLSGFKGTADVAGNSLSWVSENELDNAGFEIERSTDGLHFEKIGMVSGRGNSTSRQEYNYVDQYAVPATAYYRLKQVDVNGSFSYSAVVLIRRAQGMDLLAYPNPFANRLFVELKNTNSTNIKGLQLMDVAGRLYPVTASYTVNGFVLNTEQLQGGVYFLQWNNDGAVYRTMVIKSR